MTANVRHHVIYEEVVYGVCKAIPYCFVSECIVVRKRTLRSSYAMYVYFIARVVFCPP